MQFTIPFIRSSKTVSRKPNEQVTEKEYYNQEHCINEYGRSTSSHFIILPQGFQQTLSPQNVGSNIKRSKNCAASGIDDDNFNAKKARLEQKADDKIDSRKMFLLSLLDDIRAMSDDQMRTFKREVFGVIEDIFAEPQ